MSEERVPCDARSGHIEPKVVSEEEIEKAEKAAAVVLPRLAPLRQHVCSVSLGSVCSPEDS
jgi:hypothetical protein